MNPQKAYQGLEQNESSNCFCTLYLQRKGLCIDFLSLETWMWKASRAGNWLRRGGSSFVRKSSNVWCFLVTKFAALLATLFTVNSSTYVLINVHFARGFLMSISILSNVPNKPQVSRCQFFRLLYQRQILEVVGNEHISDFRRRESEHRNEVVLPGYDLLP